MDIISTHLTNGEIGILGQVYWEELRNILALKSDKKLSVNSFYLNPNVLERAKTVEEMEERVLLHLGTMVPPSVIKRAPPNLAYGLLCMGVFNYVQGDRTVIVMSRPDDSFSLQQRVAFRSMALFKNVDVPPTKNVCAYDNLSLIGRLFTHIRQLASAEIIQEQSSEDRDCYIQYLATKEARARFACYGDIETLDMHEAIAHIMAFTQGKLPHGYLGFVSEVGCDAWDVEAVYTSITEQLAELGYAQKNRRGHFISSAEGLMVGLGEIFERHEGQISDEGGERFSRFHKSLTVDQLNNQAKKFIGSLDKPEFLKCMEQFVVFQTLKGLRQVMGKNAKRFVPNRDDTVFNQVNQLVQLSPA